MKRALFLHGMLADRRVWRDVVTALPHLDCHLAELPGHGQAQAWDGGDYQTQAYLMALAMCDGPVHLVGHSFGASVALRLAVERPELLHSLTLVDPVFFYAARQAAPEAFAAYAQSAAPVLDAIAEGDMLRAAEMFLAGWGVGGGWAALPPAARAAIGQQMPLIGVTADSLAEDTGCIWPRLPAVKCPVLIVTGGQSDPVMPAIAQGLQQRLPRASSVQIAQAGHMIPVTHGAQLGQQIAAFTA